MIVSSNGGGGLLPKDDNKLHWYFYGEFLAAAAIVEANPVKLMKSFKND